jgi:uncharacterized membrane protein
MNNRPRITLEQELADRFLIISGFAVVFLVWLLIIWQYGALPDTVPTHFNARGEPDGYGSKFTILILGILGTVIFIGLETLSHYPHSFNYTVNITPENAPAQYRLATRFIRLLNLSMALIFLIVVYVIIESADGTSFEGSAWILPTILVLVFVPLIIYVLKSRNLRNQKP